MLGLTSCDQRFDAELAHESAVFVVVVTAVGDQRVGAAAGPAAQASDRWHGLEKRDQLGDVVAVAGRDREGERDPGRIDEEVVFAAGTASVDRARPRLGAPFFACTWLESAIARDHSSSPAARNRASKSACSRSQTPARCHSSRRRQQVTPEPNPSSAGSCCQAIPVCRTNKIPCSANRSSKRLRPG